MSLVASADIVLLDGILFITDSGHELPDKPLSDEEHKQGFAASEHAAMVMTGYEFCECGLEVWLSKPVTPEQSKKIVSIPLFVESGQCFVGDHIVPNDSTIEIELPPAKYLITVVQELVTEKIEDVGNTAATKLMVYFDPSDKEVAG